MVSQRFVALPTVPRGDVSGTVHICCPACRETLRYADVHAASMVCPWCDFHFPIESGQWLELLVDPGSYRSLERAPEGPSRFGQATLMGRPLALAIADPNEPWGQEQACALIALAERAQLDEQPLLWAVTAPRGVERVPHWLGVQAAQVHLEQSGLPWITLFSGPCYGPIAALGLQADLVLAEPGTVASPLLPEVLREHGHYPADSVSAARRLLQKGQVDAIARRGEQRWLLATLFDLLGAGGREGSALAQPSPRVGHEESPLPLKVLAGLCAPFVELHGDRQAGDDACMVGGLARLRACGTAVLVLATSEGEGWPKLRRRHGGAIGLHGWRKASRLLQLAARFGLPILTLVSTPSLRLRRRDLPEALAASLGGTVQALLSAPVPTVAVRLADSDGWPTMALTAADRVLASSAALAGLQRDGIAPDEVLGDEGDLGALLSRQLAELTQTYAVRGPLGRRKLLERRHVRWSRLPIDDTFAC